jgi:hypothetical protein
MWTVEVDVDGVGTFEDEIATVIIEVVPRQAGNLGAQPSLVQKLARAFPWRHVCIADL